MTVPVIYAPESKNGDGATVAFEFDFIAPTTGDVKVTLVTKATNIGVLQANPADYSVVLNATGIGGTVTMVVPPANLTERLLTELDLATTQVTDIPNVGGIQEEKIEDPLDRAVLNIQLLEARLDDVFKISTIVSTDPSLIVVTEVSTPVDGKALVWAESPAGTFTLVNSTLNLSDLEDDIAAIDQAVIDAQAARTGAELAETNAGTSETNSAASAAASAASATSAATNATPMSVANNVKWATASVTTVTIEAGSQVQGKILGAKYEFTAAKTFDIAAAKGAGAIAPLFAGGATANEANSTKYVLVAIMDSTAVKTPHVMALTETEYLTFVVSDITALGYDDYKRIGWFFNNSGGDIELCYYDEGFCWFDDQTAFSKGGITSAIFVDVDYSPQVPAFIRKLKLDMFNTTANTTFWKIKASSGNGFQLCSADSLDDEYVDVLVNASGVFEVKTSAGTLAMYIHGYFDDLQEEGQ